MSENENKESIEGSKNQEQTDEDETASLKISNIVVEMMASLASISAIKRCLGEKFSKDAALAEKAHDAIFAAVRDHLEEGNLSKLENLSVDTYIGELFTTLSSIGYLKMGLPVETNAKYRDLEDAKVAIDSIAKLLESCKYGLREEQQKQLTALVANMQMSFVSLSGESAKKE